MAIVILGVSQLVLPSLAEHVARERIDRDGRVLSLHISAVPAVELLFGDADRATVRLADFRASQSQVATDIGQSAGVKNLNVQINELRSGLLDIDGVTVIKRGPEYTATGLIRESALRAAVPLLTSVTPVSASGAGLTLRGTANIPFVGAVSATVNVAASQGRVVLSGTGPLGSFLHLTLWSNPRVVVQSVGGAPAAGGLELSARWRLG